MIEKILQQHCDVFGKSVEDVLHKAIGDYFSVGGGRDLPVEQKRHVTTEIRHAALKEFFNKKQSFPMNISNPCGPR